MLFHKTKIEGVYILEPEFRTDARGYFTRNVGLDEFDEKKIPFKIVQVNRSFTKERGTIRGLHFQKSPAAEDKLIQCLKGGIYDVIVDLRPGSKTYREWVGEELTEDNKKMLLACKGTAHGFQAMTDNAEVQYFVSEYYTPALEGGIRWNDPAFTVVWPITNPALSEKDQAWPLVPRI